MSVISLTLHGQTKQLQLRKLLDVAKLEEIFNKMGADKQYTTLDSEVAPSYGSDPGTHYGISQL